jgi:hypothetical protein
MRAAALAILLAGCYDLDAVSRPSARDDGGESSDAPGASDAPDALGDAPPSAELYRALILEDGPIAYWRLDETSIQPSAADELGDFPGLFYSSGAPGTGTMCALGGESVFGPGQGAALHLIDGCEVVVENDVGDAFDFSAQAPFSVECWVKSEVEPAGPRRLFGKQQAGEGYALYDEDNILSFGRYQVPNADLVMAAYSVNVWQHIAATYDGATMRVYLDGCLFNSGPSANQIQPTDNGFGLGGANGSGFTGFLDECAVYADALTPGQIAARVALVR